MTKRPKDIRSVTLETDSQGGYRIATDIGDIVGENQQFGYRINLAHEEIHPYVEHTNGKRLLVQLLWTGRFLMIQNLSLILNHNANVNARYRAINY